MPQISLLVNPTRYLFFTGKGGVGKTSLATASAIAIADAGRRVLLVSTDPASNLDEILGVELRNVATPVPGVDHLELLNIDPETAAEAYRARVLAQMGGASAAELATVREELSGACTTEIASFDAFATLLAVGVGDRDHVIFDTAPSGHTLRLLSLPQAWTGFLADNAHGASCLGPHSGLEMQESMFRAALTTLTDAAHTTVVLVTRPETAAITEAARMSGELIALGLTNQRVVINGVFHASAINDAVARSIEDHGRAALAAMPAALAALPRDEVPLRGFDVVGREALRALLDGARPAPERPRDSATTIAPPGDEARLSALADELSRTGRGLIMVMGKGGVGKTTIAAALAVGLVERGHPVHLSTTDPAAHLAATLAGQLEGLTVSRIDPAQETRLYIDKIMATRGAKLNADERALLLEDLRSPCTEEVAVFHAFSHLVNEARDRYVVLDTAPTGHSLMLMDATGTYHRQVLRGIDQGSRIRVITPLMRLQDPDYTRILLVTLPEIIPVSQAAALQDDLRRARIEPYAWIVNRSVLAAGTEDPLLLSRVANEREQMARIAGGLADRTYVIPWLTSPPVGLEELTRLVS